MVKYPGKPGRINDQLPANVWGGAGTGGKNLEILPGRSDIVTGWGVWVSRVEMAGKNVLDKAMNRRKT